MQSRHAFEIDLNLYERAHGLFVAKRERLHQDVFALLARDVIDRLARERIEAADSARNGPRRETDPATVDAFCNALLAPDATSAVKFFEEVLVPAAATRNDLYDPIAAASRRLGDRWEADEVTFMQVTISVGKLYALVRSIGVEPGGRPIPSDPRKCALFASVPGEKHTLGVTIAAEVFRNAGWDIDLLLDRSHDELLDRAQTTQPTVLGLSVSGQNGLDTLAPLVVSLRLVAPSSLVAVAGGPGTDHDVLRKLVDLDLLVTDAQTAEGELCRMLQRPSHTLV